jgi:hypothetical protein
LNNCKHCGADYSNFRRETDLINRFDYLICRKCGEVILPTISAVDVSFFKTTTCVVCEESFEVERWGKEVCSDDCFDKRRKEKVKKYRKNKLRERKNEIISKDANKR